LISPGHEMNVLRYLTSGTITIFVGIVRA